MFDSLETDMKTSPEPPFKEAYKNLISSLNDTVPSNPYLELFIVQDCELPLIDLSKLKEGNIERENCMKEIAKASREWGFFQVVNHGISRELLEKMRSEQMKLFRKPFIEKINDDKRNGHLLSGCYRWGTPSATCLEQVSWTEAFHVPLNVISGSKASGDVLSTTMEKFAKPVWELAHMLAGILAEELGNKSTFFKETCLPSTCYLRMNRYPPCPISPQLFGLMPHTDSDFITILHQDQIGGLQLVKDGKWFAVKPRPDALIINIGDLFQAWSNGIYKSVEHRVVTNMLKERFSIAFFMCPSYETEVKSFIEPSVYKKFTFKEFKEQVQVDVKKFGYKAGLSRFLN